jgi:hypothetical protein
MACGAAGFFLNWASRKTLRNIGVRRQVVNPFKYNYNQNKGGDYQE